MFKTVAVAMTALLLAASPFAHAQNAPARHTDSTSSADWQELTDMRIKITKAALQLRPDQEKYWPAVEQAIRSRASDRQDRLAKIRQRVEQLRDQGPAAGLQGNRNPIDFLKWRASALAQRSAGLTKLADAWEPLYRTLDTDQKDRMRFVTLIILSRVRHAMGPEDDEDSGED